MKFLTVVKQALRDWDTWLPFHYESWRNMTGHRMCIEKHRTLSEVLQEVKNAPWELPGPGSYSIWRSTKYLLLNSLRFHVIPSKNLVEFYLHYFKFICIVCKQEMEWLDNAKQCILKKIYLEHELHFFSYKHQKVYIGLEYLALPNAHILFLILNQMLISIIFVTLNQKLILF